MSQSSHDDFPRRPDTNSFVRWLVPVIYGICIMLFGWNTWEDYSRVTLAEDVARVINEGNPETLEEWEALVAEHVGERLNDYPSPDNPLHSFRGVKLSPDVLLTLWVEYESETGKVVKTWMIFAASEYVPLDAPRHGLPEPRVYPSLTMLLAGVVFSGLWVWASRATKRTQIALGVIAVLPLPLFVFLALISLLRIIAM